MKNYLTILLFYPILSFGQFVEEFPSVEGKINFNGVIQVDSLNQNQLYLNSKEFFANSFKSAKDVVQMDDKDNFIIIGKGLTDIYAKIIGTPYPVMMWYTIKIQSKEGRYKYEIYDIYFENYPSNYVLPDGSAKTQTAEDIFNKNNYYKKNGQPKNSNLNFKTQTLESIELLKSKIIDSMKNNSSLEDDNW